MARFSPALAAMFRPGCSTVPLADRAMFLMLSFSKRITSKDRASMVDVFSHQSLRRFASRAFRRATLAYSAAFRALPFCARAARRWCLRILARSREVSFGQFSFRPSDRAAVMVTPRSTPMISPVPGAGIGSGTTANAMCH